MLIITGSSDTGSQIFGREVAKIEVLCTDTLEAVDGLLRGTNGGEFSDKFIFPGSLEGLDLRGTGVRQMVEIKGIRNQTLQVVIRSRVTLTRTVTTEDIVNVEPGLLALALIDLVQSGSDIELAALTTENTASTGKERLGDAILSLSPEWRKLARGIGRLVGGE